MILYTILGHYYESAYTFVIVLFLLFLKCNNITLTSEKMFTYCTLKRFFRNMKINCWNAIHNLFAQETLFLPWLGMEDLIKVIREMRYLNLLIESPLEAFEPNK